MWIVWVVIGYIVACGIMAGNAWATQDFPTTVGLSMEADSMRIMLIRHQTEGAPDTLFDSTTGAITAWDTTYTIDPSIRYTAWHQIFYYAGSAPIYTLPWIAMDATDTSKILTMATAHANVFYGPAGTGSGLYAVKFYVVDTGSAPDVLLSGVDVKVTSPLDVALQSATDETGSQTFNLGAGSHTVNAAYTNYFISELTYSVTADADSVAVSCYSVAPTAPSSADLANVYGYIKDAADNPLHGATVTATRMSGIGVDTSGTSVIITRHTVSDPTDSTGLFELFLRRTTNYADTTVGFYDIVATFDGNEVFKLQHFWVPASGNVNLGDTLALRD